MEGHPSNSAGGCFSDGELPSPREELICTRSHSLDEFATCDLSLFSQRREVTGGKMVLEPAWKTGQCRRSSTLVSRCNRVRFHALCKLLGNLTISAGLVRGSRWVLSERLSCSESIEEKEERSVRGCWHYTSPSSWHMAVTASRTIVGAISL